MNVLDKARLLVHVVRWRLTWSRRDIDSVPHGLPPRFVSARAAVRRIPPGAAVVSGGLAGNARCSIFYWALAEEYAKHGAPGGLTWINVGAQGGRGRVPGTVEELAAPGLLARYISGHLETAKALLRLADEGKLELHTLPQGQMSLLMEAQALGDDCTESIAGVNTFLDPRTGHGSPVTPNAAAQYIEAAGDRLRYRLPRIDVALFNAPYADAEGNIYFRHAATITENIQSAAAARANGGLVMAAVSAIVPKNEQAISMPARDVDLVVVNPRNEQTGSVPQKRYWRMFAMGGNADEREAVAELKFINHFLRITPVRGPVANALARLGATAFVRAASSNSVVNIGVGYGEEVCRLLFEHGLNRDLTFTTETGVLGGLPAPGIFFGAAINPRRMIPSSEMFKLYQSKLDVTVLGMLQVDAAGNVNLSKRGPRMLDYVGPGGMPDIVAGAKTIIFVGAWMANAEFTVADGRFAVVKPGPLKFVRRVDEVTFSGREALKYDKRVYYVTNVGIMRLTPRGLELIEVVPGVDPQRDVIDAAPDAGIVLPASGPVLVADRSVLTGERFRLAWPAPSKGQPT